ncbi:efflux RND transporter periplasmic adaptor subunit [Tissierella sp. Yu-01]|uniref:efflux RND transporter periplasmic adaptor subunit n=1 Tax=Tissierella sp. Yu-01 TaxID=3035694 RepID=UPI00240D6877|nr:efflux RND transporter periplasmic adaptor subunit [Tissierella sp. Yu-01]WFA08566.1 efflux RND transporter periplasmic adaptor subunit [Tissierella sp. Yu-01]
MKKKIIIAIIAFVVIGGISISLATQNKAVEVNTQAVIRGSIASYIEEIGEVKVKEHVNIYSPTAGKVSEVMVDIGDKVKEGDLLIKLDGEELSRSIEELEAQRSSILAQYNEAKKPVDKESIAKLNIEISNLEKRITTVEKEVNDKKVLFDAGAISNEEYNAAVRNLDVERGNLEKAKLDLEQLSKPVSGNILAQYEAQLKQLDLQKESLMDSGEDYKITATIEGTVLLKEVEEGSYLQPGMHIMEIGNTNDMYIESDILVGDIIKIKEGSEVILSSDDLDLTELKGKVSKIHPTAYSKVSDLGIEQKRIKIEIEIEDSTLDLKPGYELDIKIIIKKNEDTLYIPEDAVFEMDNKDFVFVVEDDKAILKEVKTGIESQRQIEVLDGLNEGDIVVLSPDNELDNGIRVKVTK